LIFGSDMITDDESSFPDPVRRITSAAAPYPKDAASPADQKRIHVSRAVRLIMKWWKFFNLRNETISLFVKMAPWTISGSERCLMAEQVLAR
jgi:hypothetical protein